MQIQRRSRMPKLMDYDAFLKNNKNVKSVSAGKELSSSDNQYNRVLYDKYVTQATLEEQRQAALTKNDDARKNALRENSVLSEKAKKYLGQQLALSGQAKTGMAESSILDLYARQASARNDINQSYKGKESDIMLEYDRQANQVDADTNARLMEIEADADIQKKTDRAESAQVLGANLESYKNNQMSFDDLINTYNKNKQSLDDSKDATLIKQYETEYVKGKISDYVSKQYAFEPTKVISVEDAVASDDRSIDSFGSYKREITSKIIGLAKSGELDRLVAESGDKPIMFDTGWEHNIIYYQGVFMQVSGEQQAELEKQIPCYTVESGRVENFN